MATSDAQPTALTGIGVSPGLVAGPVARMAPGIDRKSTRLNSSHP